MTTQTETHTEAAEPTEPQPTVLPAPRSALEAARLLTDAGHHVHYVTEAQTRCLGSYLGVAGSHAGQKAAECAGK